MKAKSIQEQFSHFPLLTKEGMKGRFMGNVYFLRTIFYFTIICSLFFSCASKKESPQLQVNNAKRDSLMEKFDSVLHQDTSAQTIPTKKIESNPKIVQQEKEAPRLPETLPQVNVAIWSGMTFQRLDHLLSELSRTSPPSIQYYGICDKIIFSFSDNRHAAKLKEITCNLDNAYKIKEALEALGFAVVKTENVRTKTFIESSVSNEGITRVQSMLMKPSDSTTKKIIIIYK